MKAFTINELQSSLQALDSKYHVFAPANLHDGTRSLSPIGKGPLSLKGGYLVNKPTCVFFPKFEHVLTIEGNSIDMQQPPDKPLLVIGFTAEDADCLQFIDKFFTTDYVDDLYWNKRKKALIGVVSGRCGQNGDFYKLSSGNCDIELICDGDKFILKGHSEKGNDLIQAIPGGTEVQDAVFEAMKQESDALPDDDLKAIQQASKLIMEEKVPEEFWDDIADRCIACTSCNLVCPTCTCFEAYDCQHADDRFSRYRRWDSCQFDGFMREASGHNPMGRPLMRTRRRIHHKLAADVTRFGTITCFLCGRCDDVCPTNIGIKSVSKELVSKYS